MTLLPRPLVLFLVALLAAPALAAPDAGLAKARAHFQAAEKLFKSGAFDRAIDEYQAAYALTPRPGLLFNIGAAYRKKAESGGSIDDRKQALAYYQRYLEADPKGKASADAAGFVAALKQEIAASEPPPSTPAPEPVAPRPAAEPAAPPPSPPGPVVAPEPPAAPPPADAGDGGALRTAGIVTAAAGVALVATGVYFGLQARSISSDLDGLHDHWDQGLYDRGQAAQRNFYLCAGAGAAAIAGGAVLYFVLGRHSDVAPVVGPQAAGVVVQGRF